MNNFGTIGLKNLNRNELAKEWEIVFRCPAPKAVGKRVLRAALTHYAQSRKHGELTPSCKRQLLRSLEPSQKANKKRQTLQTGTRLIRDWNGQKHVVEVIEDGIVWNGRIFSSLSAIAREITGARWSGPRFFGL